jgi:ubiquinone/menaquinone biosynthesis C-methylase UbiE
MDIEEEYIRFLAMRYLSSTYTRYDLRLHVCFAQNEKDRMDIYHKFFEVARGHRLFNAPVILHNPKDPARILDVGCGTGIWAIDMAEYVP